MPVFIPTLQLWVNSPGPLITCPIFSIVQFSQWNLSKHVYWAWGRAQNWFCRPLGPVECFTPDVYSGTRYTTVIQFPCWAV